MLLKAIGGEWRPPFFLRRRRGKMARKYYSVIIVRHSHSIINKSAKHPIRLVSSWRIKFGTVTIAVTKQPNVGQQGCL